MRSTRRRRLHRVLDWVMLLGLWVLTAGPGMFLLVVGGTGLADPASVQPVNTALAPPPAWRHAVLAAVGVVLLVWPAGVVLSRWWPPRGSMADAGACEEAL